MEATKSPGGMYTEDYLKFHEDICDACRAITKAKNNDYAAADEHQDDPMRVFRNFRVCENLGITSTENGFLVRLSDKFSRICNLLQESHTQTVADESIDDTLKDTINYLILLAAYRENKRKLQ